MGSFHATRRWCRAGTKITSSESTPQERFVYILAGQATIAVAQNEREVASEMLIVIAPTAQDVYVRSPKGVHTALALFDVWPRIGSSVTALIERCGALHAWRTVMRLASRDSSFLNVDDVAWEAFMERFPARFTFETIWGGFASAGLRARRVPDYDPSGHDRACSDPPWSDLSCRSRYRRIDVVDVAVTCPTRPENLFLRKQLALYQERKIKPHRPDDATRITLVALSRFLKWRSLLTIVKAETLIRWHRKGFGLFWRWKSRVPGRPPISANLQQLIATMAVANRTWGEERITAELLVKLGIRVSSRTVRRYMPPRPPRPRQRQGTQVWSAFVRNHAQWVLASDFFVVVTATFRVLYVFVILDVGTRRLLHCNVTPHPTADWAAQQFRMIVPGDQAHQFVIHDRDTIYSEGVDRALEAMGLAVLKTPVRVPQANAFCERLIGIARRECLDFVIPLSERHVRAVLREWVTHYNRGRPHASLGPAVPERARLANRTGESARHQLPDGYRVGVTPVLGGLHHEYRLEREAA